MKVSKREALFNALTGLERPKWTGDPEADHVKADRLLLEYIGDEEITAAFEKIEKWYA